MKMNWWGPLIRISTYLVIEAAVSTSVDMKWNAARVREWWICSSTLQWSGRKFGLCRSRDAKVPRQLTSDANLAGLSLSFKTWWFETKRSVYEFPRIDLLRWRVSNFPVRVPESRIRRKLPLRGDFDWTAVERNYQTFPRLSRGTWPISTWQFHLSNRHSRASRCDRPFSWTSSLNQMGRRVKVPPTSGRVESDISVDLPAEHMSAFGQTEDNLTSPPSCLFTFSVLSISALSLAVVPFCSFLLSPPPSASVSRLPCLSDTQFIHLYYQHFFAAMTCMYILAFPRPAWEHWLSSCPQC